MTAVGRPTTIRLACAASSTARSLAPRRSIDANSFHSSSFACLQCGCAVATVVAEQPAEEDAAPVAVHDAEDEQEKDEIGGVTNGLVELDARSRDEAEAGSRALYHRGDPNKRSHHVTKSWEPSCSRRPRPHRATRRKPDAPHKACFVKRHRLRLRMPSKHRCWPYGPLYTVLQIARRQPAHLGLGLTGLGSPEYRSSEGNLF